MPGKFIHVILAAYHKPALHAQIYHCLRQKFCQRRIIDAYHHALCIGRIGKRSQNIKYRTNANRSISSKSGAGDVLEALGVNISAEPEVVAKCVEEAGIGFLFAPSFYMHFASEGLARGPRILNTERMPISFLAWPTNLIHNAGSNSKSSRRTKSDRKRGKAGDEPDAWRRGNAGAAWIFSYSDAHERDTRFTSER